jgi:small subunit ribosomal protein S10
MAKQKQQRIQIRLKGYDRRILDQAVKDIVDAAQKSGARVLGPTFLPTKREIWTVLRSPHIHKKAREQFEIRTHKRYLIIMPTVRTIDVLKGLVIPAGVDIKLQAA